MLGGWPAGGIWLSTEPADMRRSFDGLCALVSSHLGENPASGRWYVFVNRRRTMVKVLGFEHGGFFIWAKRLEQGLFASPGALASGRAALSLSRTELSALLEGIDITVRRRRKRYAGALAPVTGRRPSWP